MPKPHETGNEKTAYGSGEDASHGLKLAVGCGGNPEYPNATLRDVNLDIRIPNVDVKNFVLADAVHLPFRRKAFEEVYGAHIIEHLDDPEAFIIECTRVGECYEISTPQWFSAAAYIDPTHKWVWFAGKFRRIPRFLSQLSRFLFANKLADSIFGGEEISRQGETTLRCDSK